MRPTESSQMTPHAQIITMMTDACHAQGISYDPMPHMGCLVPDALRSTLNTARARLHARMQSFRSDQILSFRDMDRRTKTIVLSQYLDRVHGEYLYTNASGQVAISLSNLATLGATSHVGPYSNIQTRAIAAYARMICAAMGAPHYTRPRIGFAGSNGTCVRASRTLAPIEMDAYMPTMAA